MYKGFVMNGLVHIDSLYLVVKYPYMDVFKYWYRHAERAEYRILKKGIQHGDFIVKGGASCYKVSVWQHDARAFFTDQVDETLGENKGSGIWVQLGPKFLIHNINNLHEAVKEFLKSLGIRGDHPIKINRLDIAMDLFGVSMQEQDLSFWQKAWVGRSKVSGFILNSRTGQLETIYIGSRNSAIFLRVYDKLAQAIKEGEILYWLDIWKDNEGTVTRIEWVIKPDEGKFSDNLKDFSLFDDRAIRETLNYLIDWGRLCIPNPVDCNNRRWQDAPLWKQARTLVVEFSKGVDWPCSRYGKEFHGISDDYVKFLSGTVSGGMARFGLDKPSMRMLIEGLENNGHSLEAIQRVAEKKAAIIKRL
jgi:hypothetical protein